MSLQRVLGPNVAVFLRDHYQRLPFSMPGGAAELCSLGSWEVLLSVLTDEHADAMVVRRNRRYEGPIPTSVEQAQRLVEQGYTLLVKQAEKHDPHLGELARGLAEELAAPVNIHIYCTPPEQYGFAWHYDAEEVFIVQTVGNKQYSLRKNTVNPWPLEETLPADMHYEREIMPVMNCRLAAGDWLYIPSGYWHMGAVTATADEVAQPAISLSIGIMPRTGLDLLDHARAQLLESLLWRQRLPVAGAAALLDEDQLRGVIGEIAQQLSADFAQLVTRPTFIESLVAQLRTSAIPPTPTA